MSHDATQRILRLGIIQNGKIVEEGKTETEKAKVEASKLFNEMLHRANVVTKDQYDALAARVTDLEGKLHQHFPNED